jgi:radical SAM superfamily enzyme YgiQ (UPF0313 family)
VDRTPEAITHWLEGNLHRFDGPQQFLGTEPNADRRLWETAPVRWLLAASWDYSQASGNMAIPTVYAAIHHARSVNLCDRWYLPATRRDLGLLEKGAIPVFGIESRHQARDFDVVATSISYTVLFMNFVKHLSMSGIPPRRADRKPEDYPMVMVGGQAFCAPEFMSPVVDCFWLGEVEDEDGNPGGIGEVSDRIAMFKESGDWEARRRWCYDQLALEFDHLYFPHTVEFSYGYQDRGLPELSKQVTGYWSTLPGQAFPRRARKVKNIDSVPPLVKVPLLFSDPAMGAGDLEAARGCPAWCTFCRLSWVTKPYRQRSVGYTVAHARAWRANMGSNELSPFGPDFPMHTRKKELLSRLLEEVSDEVSTSSMRVDDFNADPDFAMLLGAGGTSSITLGLEGNSQRMRDLAGKGTSDEDVVETVTRAIAAGIRKIKLYMISNWPGEEAGDVMGIVHLAERLAAVREDFGEAGKGVRIQFSWTPLLIEAQTPLQWFAPTSPDYRLQSAMDMLKDLHIDMKIGSKASPPKLAFFQACQRAHREAGEAILDVLLDLGDASWGGFAKDMKERLDTALQEHGFRNGLEDLFGERYEDDLFGWEHIDTGVSRSLMWNAYRSMVELLENTDADTYDEFVPPNVHGQEWVSRCDQKCQGRACGACDAEDLRLRTGYIRAARDERDLDESPLQPIDQTTVACRVRMKVKIPEEFRYVSNESLRFIVRRAAYKATEATGFPHISKRTVRLASDALNYRNRKAGTDYVEFGVTQVVTQEDLDKFMPAMGAELHPWIVGGVAEQIVPAQARLPDRVPSLWELEISDPVDKVEAAIRRWDAAEHVMVLIKSESFYTGPLQDKEDAKDHVADIWLARDRQRYVVRMELTGKMGPYQAYAALMGRSSWISSAAKTAFCLDFFTSLDRSKGDLWNQDCIGCGLTIPAGLLGVPHDENFCPRCQDEEAGNLVAGLQHV